MCKNILKIFTYVLFFSLFLVFSQNTVLADDVRRISLTLHTDEGVVQYENRAVTIVLDGVVLPEADMPPIILQDRTFVPVRHVLEAMGAVVDFHEAEQRIMIAYGDSLIVMHIGQSNFNVNGDMRQMDVAPQIVNSRTLVPVSFIASAMGFSVEWDNATATVSLNVGGGDAVSTPVGDNNDNIPDDGNFAASYDDIDFAEVSIDLTPEPIPAETNVETSAVAINWNDSQSQFIISATSRITKIDWFILPDGRLIVDLHHATPNFERSTFNINNDFISTIRTGHNVIDDLNVARVVFDLAAPVIYQVSLSADRQHVMVAFEGNIISGISLNLSASPQSEAVTIRGTIAPWVNTFPLHDPSRLVIDMPGSVLNFNQTIEADGHFIQSVNYSQFDANTVRVVLHLRRDISYTVRRSGNDTSIIVSDPTYRNISFNSDDRLIAIRKPDAGITAGQVMQFDQYQQRRYTLVFPGDFSEFFGYGTFTIRDGALNGVDIITENGVTQFRVNTNRLMAFIVTEDEENIFIRTLNPRDKYPFVVMMDPGHGGSAPGAVHHGMRESDVNLDVANMVMDILNRDGLVRAYTTRYTDVNVANSHRAVMANQAADIFVSIHFNAAHGRAQGTEVLYTVHEREEALNFNSQHMARMFQANLVSALGSVDRGIVHRPRIEVLNSTHIPAVLLEIGFLDNPEEATRIATQEYRMMAAQAIVDTIYEVFGIFSLPRQ